MHLKFAAIAVDAVVAYSCTTDSAWVFAWTLPEVQACTTDHDLCLSCIYPQPLLHGFFSWPLSFLHLPSTPSPWLLSISRASWHIPLGSQMMTRSSAYRSSQGTPARNSRDKASSTMMKSKGLSTDSWWTLTFTSNSLLKPSPTRTWLRPLACIPWTNCTIHSSTPSFLSAHQITFRGTRSNAFSRSTKAI